MAGIGLLTQLAINNATNAEIVHIDFVWCDDPGTERCVRIEYFAHHHLRGVRSSSHAALEIIANAVAEDDLVRLRFRDMPATLADDEYRLRFVVQRLRNQRTLHLVEGTRHRSCRLGKPHLMLGHFHAGFADVIGIVETNPPRPLDGGRRDVTSDNSAISRLPATQQ